MQVLSLLISMKRVACIIYIILLLTAILILFTGCGSSDKRSEIEVAIYNSIEAAEKKDINEFMKVVSEDYYDSAERSKSDIRDKVKIYLNRFRGISVNILNIKTVEKDNENAEVIMEVNFSSGIGKMFSKIVRSYGETYRFNLVMSRKVGKWAVNSAQWDWMSLDELYPESLKVLRELFPDSF